MCGDIITQFVCVQETGNRFVRVGEAAEDGRKERFVILQRSRREHYDLVLSQGEETLGLRDKAQQGSF